jgi:hypothetical protein
MDKRLTINFNEEDPIVVDTVVPAGKYRVRVTGFEKTKARTGTPQVRCDLEVLGHPEYDGCTKKEFFPLDENSLWKMKQFIRATYPDVSQLKDEVKVDSIIFDDLLEGCIGESLFICYGLGEFEGMDRNFSRRYIRLETEDKGSPPANTTN